VLREAVTRLEAHTADLRRTVETLQVQLDRAETEMEARRREVTEEREAHHKQVQALLVLAGQAALPPPIDASPVEEAAATSHSAPGASQDSGQVNSQVNGQMNGPPAASWWRRAWRWATTG
jgi:hypothetical protein